MTRKALVLTLDEALKKAIQVKPFTRVRRGRLERVSGYSRIGNKKFKDLKVGDTVVDNVEDKWEVLEIDKKNKKAYLREKFSGEKVWVDKKYIENPELLSPIWGDIEDVGYNVAAAAEEAEEGFASLKRKRK